MEERSAADLRGRHNFSEIIGYSWRIYGRNFSTLFPLALVAAPMAMLTTIIIRRIDDAATGQLVGVYMQLPSTIVEFVAVAAIILAVSEFCSGTQPDPGRSLDTGLQKFWTIFCAELIAAMRLLLAIFAAPFLALYWLYNREATIDGRRDWYFALIPGALVVYLLVRWYFVPNAVVMHEKRSWAALDDSARAVRGSWWRTLGILIVVGLIQLGFALTAASASAYAHPVVDGLVTGLVTALILPFGVTAQTLLYYDLKARNSLGDPTAAVDAPQSDLSG